MELLGEDMADGSEESRKLFNINNYDKLDLALLFQEELKVSHKIKNH